MAVAEYRSFHRQLASKLGKSPSAISQMIRTLEDRVGTALFSRTTRSVAPTEAGEMFLGQIAPASAGDRRLLRYAERLCVAPFRSAAHQRLARCAAVPAQAARRSSSRSIRTSTPSFSPTMVSPTSCATGSMPASASARRCSRTWWRCACLPPVLASSWPQRPGHLDGALLLRQPEDLSAAPLCPVPMDKFGPRRLLELRARRPGFRGWWSQAGLR